MRLVIDIETTSACDLGDCGAAKYAAHPSTAILCMAWADADKANAEPRVWRCDSGEPIEAAFDELLRADLLIAHNAQFERRCLSAADPRFLPPALWACSAMLAGAAGRPHALRDTCRSLCLPDALEKDARGKRLLNLFSIQTSRLYIGGPEANPAAFDELCEYCAQDVRAERAVWLALAPRFYTPSLARQWAMDCAVDDAGVPVDIEAVRGAQALYEYLQAEAECAADELTGGVSLRSTPALRQWTAERGWPLHSFARDAVDEALADTLMCDACPDVARLLRLRKTMAGTAGKKFQAFIDRTSEDGRVRGTLVARVAHTGRYAGRGIQPQNMPRGFLPPEILDFTREAAYLAARGDMPNSLGLLRLVAEGQECDALASLCRDSIAAPDGHVFIVADYSAIEARVLAWLAGERWVEEIFAGDGRIYERTAAAMYGRSPDTVTPSERMAGKIATLALGFGGGVGALQRFAATYGVHWTDAEAQGIVDAWRASRPRTVALWRALNDAFITVASGNRPASGVSVGRGGFCTFRKVRIASRDAVRCELPSGRPIVYWAPQFDAEKGEIAVETYGSANCPLPAQAKGAGMTRVYGGLLAENVTQALAFDLLLNSLLALHDAGHCVILHVHDEVIVESPEAVAGQTAADVARIMQTPPGWARGMRLAVEPEIMRRYRK